MAGRLHAVPAAVGLSEVACGHDAGYAQGPRGRVRDSNDRARTCGTHSDVAESSAGSGKRDRLGGTQSGQSRHNERAGSAPLISENAACLAKFAHGDTGPPNTTIKLSGP